MRRSAADHPTGQLATFKGSEDGRGGTGAEVRQGMATQVVVWLAAVFVGPAAARATGLCG